MPAYIPAGIYLLKFNNRNTRARYEICSTVNFEHVIAGWDTSGYNTAAAKLGSSCICDKVFKSGTSKIYGRQPLKFLHSPFLNNLFHMCIEKDTKKATDIPETFNEIKLI